MNLQEAASTAASTTSDYGPLSGLVQTTGWLISSVIAIGFSWRRGGKWIPYQEDLPKAAERIGGVLTAVAVALLWALYNSWAEVPFLTRIALITAVTAVVAFLIYAFLVALQTYEKDISTATVTQSIKIIGGFTLRPAAKKKAKTQTVQAMFKDAAYDPDAIWEKPGRATAQALFALLFILMTFAGTVALSSAAMVLMISQTDRPKDPPKEAELLKGLTLAVLDNAASGIAIAGGPTASPAAQVGYRVLIETTTIGRAPAISASSGAIFPFEYREGTHKVTVTNNNKVTWVCQLTLTKDTLLYGVTGLNGDACEVGPLAPSVYQDFLQRRKDASASSPAAKGDAQILPAVRLAVFDSTLEILAGSPKMVLFLEWHARLDDIIVSTKSSPTIVFLDPVVQLTQVTLGEHKVTLESSTRSLTCMMNVVANVSHYAVEPLGKSTSECKISQMSESAYNTFAASKKLPIVKSEERNAVIKG